MRINCMHVGGYRNNEWGMNGGRTWLGKFVRFGFGRYER